MELDERQVKIFDDDRCYRPDEVAQMFNYDTRSIYRMSTDPLDPLPAFQFRKGGPYRYHGRELNDFVARHRVDPLNEERGDG